MIVRRWQAFLAAALLLSACSERGELAQARSPLATEAPLPTAEAPAPATGTLDRWLGRWNGPEGTYLLLGRNDDGGYVLEIADLDGPRRFDAAADGEALRFERNGQTEHVRATDGQATGMKWLLEKSDCLTVKPGEGYCRD